MESNKILGADILDILFEGRNKEYGAYVLRKTYNKRLARAMAAMCSMILLLFLSGFVTGHGNKKAKTPMFVKDDSLSAIKDPVVQPPPPPPPPRPPVPQVRMLADMTPRIVPDDKADAPPPTNDELENAKIGPVTTPGVADDGIVAPPVDDGKKGIVVAPKKEDDGDGIFEKVEVESSYPGGIQAWIRYLGKNMHYPDPAINDGIQGTVMVKFIVDKDGNVSDVEAIAGPEQDGLREEAVRVIRKSGKWTPALQNGRYVKSYKQQPVTFKLSD